MKNLLKKITGRCSICFYLVITIIWNATSCNTDQETPSVQQALLYKVDTTFQLEAVKRQKPYTSYNSVIIISGYREGEYWVSRYGPNGKILWDSLSLNIPTDTSR